MKKQAPDLVDEILLFFAGQAIRFILVTAFLCGIGFIARHSGGEPVTFHSLLWNGTVSFWFSIVGQVFLLALVAVIVRAIWKLLQEGLAFKKRHEALDKEVENQAQKRAEILVRKAEDWYRQDYEMKELTLSADWVKLEKERMELASRLKGLQDREAKIGAWKQELSGLRNKLTSMKEKTEEKNRRINWARTALTENPPNVGLARRHLKAAAKM